MSNKIIEKKRDKSDEHYVIELCSEILNQEKEVKTQYGFDFLRGDVLKNGILVENVGRKLPVDAFYEKFNLVVEYWERQHTEHVSFFDKKKTCDGRTRAEQRAIYDQRRKDLLPKNGIKLVIIKYSDFGERKRLCRNREHDIAVIKQKLIDEHVLNVDGEGKLTQSSL